ncbi:HAD-IIB family hydrolase [Actinoplanes sp. NPDC051859]|uniref:HAD-IIB family hydrolase n=1 Tax=Actinoplanes sp. NPDC051859 TaxID=3363909 RepID=UPI0037A015E5
MRTPETSPLYVCDLDGTLLGANAALSDYARTGLCRLLAAGVALTVASARGVVSMAHLLAGVPIRLPVVELDGAFLSDLTTGQHRARRTLPSDLIPAILRSLEDAGTAPVLTSWDPRHDRDHVSYGARLDAGASWYVEEKRRYGDPRLRPTSDLAEVARTDQIATVTAFVPDADRARLVARLRAATRDAALVTGAPHVYLSGWSEVQVRHPTADKGTAVQHLATMSGLAHAPLTVCGDHLNDLPMFAVADRCVAPANAHERVRRAATVVTASHDEDGIVRFLLADNGLATENAAADSGQGAPACSW